MLFWNFIQVSFVTSITIRSSIPFKVSVQARHFSSVHLQFPTFAHYFTYSSYILFMFYSLFSKIRKWIERLANRPFRAAQVDRSPKEETRTVASGRGISQGCTAVEFVGEDACVQCVSVPQYVEGLRWRRWRTWELRKYRTRGNRFKWYGRLEGDAIWVTTFADELCSRREATDTHNDGSSLKEGSRLGCDAYCVDSWELSEWRLWASKKGTASFVEKREWVHDGEGITWEDVTK